MIDLIMKNKTNKKQKLIISIMTILMIITLCVCFVYPTRTTASAKTIQHNFENVFTKPSKDSMSYEFKVCISLPNNEVHYINYKENLTPCVDSDFRYNCFKLDLNLDLVEDSIAKIVNLPKHMKLSSLLRINMGNDNCELKYRDNYGVDQNVFTESRDLNIKDSTYNGRLLHLSAGSGSSKYYHGYVKSFYDENTNINNIILGLENSSSSSLPYGLTYFYNATYDIPQVEYNESQLKNSVYGLAELFPNFDTNSFCDWYCCYMNENGIMSAAEINAPYSYQVRDQEHDKWDWKSFSYIPAYKTLKWDSYRAYLKYIEKRYNPTFQMLESWGQVELARYFYNKMMSYTAYADKYDELVPQKLAEKKTINLTINVAVKGSNYPVDKQIKIPLNVYKIKTMNEDDRYYRLILSRNDMDFLINDLNLRCVDITHKSFGESNVPFENDSYVTKYYKKVNASNGDVILDELISFCIPFENSILENGTDTDFTINAVCEANKDYTNSFYPDHKIEHNQVAEYNKSACIRVFLAEDTIFNNLSTSEIIKRIEEGKTPPRYNMISYMPCSLITEKVLAGIEKMYNEDYGGSCRFLGVSKERNNTTLLQAPTSLLKNSTNDLYIVTEKNQSRIVVKTNKSQTLLYSDYGQTLDSSVLPKTLEFQGKSYDIIGWTEEKVLYPWDLGYGPGRTYNMIDFTTWTVSKNQHYLSPVLKADLPVVIPDPEAPDVIPEPEPSPIVKNWNNFCKWWQDLGLKITNHFSQNNKEWKIFAIVLASVVGAGFVIGLTLRFIRWVKGK